MFIKSIQYFLLRSYIFLLTFFSKLVIFIFVVFMEGNIICQNLLKNIRYGNAIT